MLRLLLITSTGVAASACSTLRYYAHVTHGELGLLAARMPVAVIIADPAADAKLRARLQQAQAARAFASDHLALPRNRSYTSYVDLGRPYVTWNVFATPEFSVDPVTHCFPFAGCVAYLGFFDRARAERAEKRFVEQGDDTAIEGAAAYSTLGWFADPILSSMLRWSDDELDGVIFHELAHQQLYVKGDTAFNESYASFVQEQGLLEWRAERGLPAPDETRHAHDEAFTRLVLDLRERLRVLFAKELPVDEMRPAKQREFVDFRLRYARLRDAGWGDDRRYDAWVAAPINNAKLVPFGLYERWVSAFARLFQDVRGQWAAFHAHVRKLALLPGAERERVLAELAARDAAPHDSVLH
ncbi:aminopeptidase [Dokdonella soli]